MKSLLTAFTPVLIVGQSLLLAQGTAQITDPEPRHSIEVLVSTDSLREAAEKGDDEAQTELAKIYFRGTEPAPRDIQGGIELLNKAVQKKNPEAQLLLGACLCAGVGQSKDYLSAIDYFQRAASNGCGKAYLCMYAMYRDGCGVDKNNDQAIRFLQQGIDARSPEALCEMALLRLKGFLGLGADRASALSYLRQAAEAGSERAIAVCGTDRSDAEISQDVEGWDLFRPAELINEPNGADSSLKQAAVNNDLPLLNYLLEQKGNPRLQCDEDALCALTAAARHGYTDIVLRLLECGIYPNERDTEGTTALIAAAGEGKADMVKLLLDNGARKDVEDSTGATALEAAQRSDDAETIRLLGGTPESDRPTPPDEAPSAPSIEEGARQQLARVQGLYFSGSLERAYQKRVIELLQKIANGAPIDTRLDAARNNTTALHNACAICDLELVQWLVANGADLNARAKNGATPYVCVGEDRVKGPIVRKWIKQAQANPSSVSRPAPQPVATSSSSLAAGARQQIARVQGLYFSGSLERAYQKRVIELLQKIANGAPIDTRLDAARNNTTALHNACAICDLELVQWLVANGADLNARAKNGATPYVCVGDDRVKGPIVRKWIKQAQANRR